MTRDEINEGMKRPDQIDRTHIIVREDGEEFVAEWDGEEVRAGNPFGLDSALTDAGAPRPRSLWLLTEETP
ncbi:hypothetical protein [Brachybacterium massiliense]|uniref:hypothetical protein n=1 Tax=Brachybacterium massiliense TaxID=1755098 RepID=UPI000B3BB9EB|nr:hypothetical protein [Brachybacterium massiliense]